MVRALVTNSLVVLVSMLVAALAGELAVRLVAPQELGIWSTTRDGIVIHTPNLRRYSQRHGQVVQINSLGMRDREHSSNSGEDGGFRILLLGDSFMEALQVSFDESFPSLLERELERRTKRPVEVWNLGVSGWGTDDQLTYLSRYGLALRPDLVLIAMTLHNDVSDNLRMTFHELRDGKLHEKPREEIPLLRYAFLRTKIFLASHSHLYQLVWRTWRAREFGVKAQQLNSHVAQLIRRKPDERTQKGWELTYRLLDETQREASHVGAEIAVFLIPLANQLSKERLSGFLDRHGLSEEEVAPEAPQEAMRRWGARERVEVIDLLPAFRKHADGRPEIFYLEADGHWTVDGHRLAAELVSQEILGRGLVPRTTPGNP